MKYGYLVLIVASLGLTTLASAHEQPLAFYCFDSVNQKELTVFEGRFSNEAEIISVRDLITGEVVSTKAELTIIGSDEQITVWRRPSNHGGTSVSFHAKLINNQLTGNGFGLKNALCCYTGE